MGLLYVVFVYSNAQCVSEVLRMAHKGTNWGRQTRLCGGWPLPASQQEREGGLMSTVVLVPTEAGSQL